MLITTASFANVNRNLKYKNVEIYCTWKHEKKKGPHQRREKVNLTNA